MSFYVLKRNGRRESVHFDKITSRVSKLCYGLNSKVRTHEESLAFFWFLVALVLFSFSFWVALMAVAVRMQGWYDRSIRVEFLPMEGSNARTHAPCCCWSKQKTVLHAEEER